jgi:hypothetical protein
MTKRSITTWFHFTWPLTLILAMACTAHGEQSAAAQSPVATPMPSAAPASGPAPPPPAATATRLATAPVPAPESGATPPASSAASVRQRGPARGAVDAYVPVGALGLHR